MKQILLAIAVIGIISCGNKTKTETLPQIKDKPLDIPELVSYIGKSYTSVERNFKEYSPKTTTNLGDKTVDLFAKDNAAPITSYSVRVIEKNGVISNVVIASSLAGHEKNRETLKYFDDKLTYPIARRYGIDVSGNPKIGIFDTKEDFYTYLRNNPDYGGSVSYNTTVNLNLLASKKSANSFGIVIEKK